MKKDHQLILVQTFDQAEVAVQFQNLNAQAQKLAISQGYEIPTKTYHLRPRVNTM